MNGERTEADGPAEPLVGIRPRTLREVTAGELAIRFAFGAAVSVLAGVVGLVAGTFLGGMLLAFPAILPATVTLLEKKEGNAAARHDVAGAALGAVALSAFAVVAGAALRRLGGGLSLPLAALAWFGVAGALYLASEAFRRRRRGRRAEP